MGEQLCTNCKREIPDSNFSIHVIHCSRNIALCSDCNEPIPRQDLEKHREETHSLQDCSLCGEKIEACRIEEHQKGPCPKQTTLCKYCATHVEQGVLQEHENYCGSRTEKCKDCGEFIMLMNYELHINSNHGFIKLDDDKTPKPSAEKSRAEPYSGYSSRLSKYSDPTPSTPTQRSNFSATELFNNQDLYSSRRYSSTASTSLYKSSSSSVVSSGVSKSSSSSLVSSLHKSNSNSIVSKVLSGESKVETKSISKLSSISDDSTDVERLPCEFCDAMIPMYKLLSHQAECVNPSNVRGGNDTSSSSTFRPYSSLRNNNSPRDSAISRDTASRLESSISRSSSLNAGASSNGVNRYMRQSSSSAISEAHSSSLSRYGSNGSNGEIETTKKISPTSSSIVGRYLTSPEPSTYKSKNIPDSPPEQAPQAASVYMGRSSYLKQEVNHKEVQPKKATVQKAPGLYENDTDREGLRQMLSGLRRDPMDVEDDPDNNDGSFFPCEFCGDPYPSEFIMRHQMSCDLNPCPVSSGNGFDYSQIQKSIARNLGIEAPAPVRKTSNEEQQSSRLSRSNSVIDKSYSRSGRASSVSRTSSFADRSYGTRTNLARHSSFSIADYSSAVRRSSVFDGYAGYSIYSSISDGLDQITYGGRTSRRNSITEMSYSFSRRGSVSAGTDYPMPALMAALDASKASQDERKEKHSSATLANAHVNGQATAYLNSHQYSSISRQNSTNDSPKAIDSPFGIVNGHHLDLQRSDSGSVRRKSSVRHSVSGHKLERKVSFHSHDQIIANEGLDENGDPTGKPDKPKRKKERTEEEKAARREKKERKERKRQERGASKDRRCKDEVKNKIHLSGDDLMVQVSAKLQDIERQQNDQEPELSPLPSSSLIPHIVNQASKPANNNASSISNKLNEGVDNILTEPQTTVTDEDLINLHDSENSVSHENSTVTRRESDARGSKLGSKRNSLDNKSVQSLAKDLAAECAKAYELMESSLSKLTNDFSIGPFGLTPKNKKKYRAPAPPPPLK